MDHLSIKTEIPLSDRDRSIVYSKYGNWSQNSYRQYFADVKIPETVTRCYQEFLCRNPEERALKSYVQSFLNDDMTVSILRKTLEESAERKMMIKKQEDFNKLKSMAKPIEELSHLRKAEYLSGMKIKWIGPVGKTGYSQSVKAYVSMLFECGANITFSPTEVHSVTDNPSEKDILLMSLLDRPLDYDIVVIEAVPNTWEPIIDSERLKNPRVKVVGLALWEADLIHPHWVGPMNKCDSIIACSEWNKQVFMKSLKIPVYTLHNPIEQMTAPDIDFKLPEINDNEFVFYTINEWTARKGIEDLIHCFLETFTSQDNVVLFIKSSTIRQFMGEGYISNQSMKYPNPPKIILNTEDWSDDKIVSLHKRGNCYISLCKSEGIGLGACEAAQVGNPVIMSSYGGQQDYLKGVFFVSCSEEAPNMCLTPHVSHDKCSPEGCIYYPWFLPKTQRWGKPSLDDAQGLMKFVYNNQSLSDDQAKLPSIYINTMLNANEIGKQAAAIFCAIMYS
jgi:glycosyltransferase involved in cell wall biosynthesis